MISFQVKYIKDEKIVIEEIQSESKDILLVELRNKNYKILDISDFNRESLFSKKWKNSEKTSWTRQLSNLIDSGFNIEKSLLFLSNGQWTDETKKMTQSLLIHIKGGSSLSNALVKSYFFDQSYIAMVAAGEESGKLAIILKQISSNLEENDQLKNKIISAAIYPMIVVFFSVCMVIFLMTYVVPQLSQMFANSNRSLPLITVIVMNISFIMKKTWWIFLIIIIGMLVLYQKFKNHDYVKYRIDSLLLRLPLFRNVCINYYNAQFTSALGLLLTAGVPLIRSLDFSKAVVNNTLFQNDIEFIIRKVKEGGSLNKSMIDSKYILPDVLSYIRLGENTGDLGSLLNKISVQVSDTLQRKVLRLSTVIEPVLIVLMGFVVMGIVLSILLPIVELNNIKR